MSRHRWVSSAIGLTLVAASTLAAPAMRAVPAAAATAGPIAYVVGSAGVRPINITTRTVGSPIPAGPAPYGIAITPDGRTGYVTGLNGSDTVTPINTATNAPGAPIPVGRRPGEIAVSPNGKTVYVVNTLDSTVTPIATATNTARTPIPVGTLSGKPLGTTSEPGALAITPDGKTLYVTVEYILNFVSYVGAVIPIATATNTPGTEIPIGPVPTGLAVTPNGKNLYVAGYVSQTNLVAAVTPIATATNTPGAAIPIGAGRPGRIAITPDGARVYALTQVVSTNDDGLVIPIATATNTPGAAISIGASTGSPVTALQGIAVTPDARTVYVSNFPGHAVVPIATATNIPGTPIPFGDTPGEVAITPDQAPLAALSVASALVKVAAPAKFSAAGSVAPSSPIVSYRWAFGDGATATTSKPTTTHAYGSLGTYTATVTETDAAGTSTARVFTGQTMSRNGSPSAIASAHVTVVPTVIPGPGSVVEGNAGSRSVVVPVTLSQAPIQPVTVNWTTLFVPGWAGAQADPATDYTPASGSVTFAPGETAKTVTISVIGDTIVEPDEHIFVSFNHPTNALLGGVWGLGAAVIVNDDSGTGP